VIVAVSHARDEHAPPVLAALRRLGAEAVLLDLADFPLRGTIALAYGGRGRARRVLRTPGGTLDPRHVSAVWWRRPEPFDLGRGLSPADAEFSFRQILEALGGLAASLDAAWVNDPWRDAAASHKPRHLALAERLGLFVPATLVTNDPRRARTFLARRAGKVVHKTLHATGDGWRPTRVVGPEDRARLDALRWAPVVFQEYVAGVDVRVTVVGDRLFATEIDARDTASPEDFRPVWREAPVASCALPADVERRLRALVSELGLRFAAIDLRRRDDGEHVFLEVNPSGQWRFLEERTGQPITEAVARLLASG
jgi:glutathione synthase/RimK-type ligase-like ATP-grasp enzyme